MPVIVLTSGVSKPLIQSQNAPWLFFACVTTFVRLNTKSKLTSASAPRSTTRAVVPRTALYPPNTPRAVKDMSTVIAQNPLMIVRKTARVVCALLIMVIILSVQKNQDGGNGDNPCKNTILLGLRVPFFLTALVLYFSDNQPDETDDSADLQD